MLATGEPLLEREACGRLPCLFLGFGSALHGGSWAASASLILPCGKLSIARLPDPLGKTLNCLQPPPCAQCPHNPGCSLPSLGLESALCVSLKGPGSSCPDLCPAPPAAWAGAPACGLEPPGMEWRLGSGQQPQSQGLSVSPPVACCHPGLLQQALAGGLRSWPVLLCELTQLGRWREDVATPCGPMCAPPCLPHDACPEGVGFSMCHWPRGPVLPGAGLP